MFDVSLPWAEFWYDTFNVLLFIGAFAVAVGTYGSIKMGSVKERFGDERISANEKETKRAVADSDAAKEGTAKAGERIAELNRDTARLSGEAESARAAIAVANERAAKAEERALEAKLELEKFRAPRMIIGKGMAMHTAFREALSPFSGTKWDATVIPNDPESTSLLAQLQTFLYLANWQQIDWSGDAYLSPPLVQRIVGANSGGGVTIALSSHDPQLTKVAHALIDALKPFEIPAEVVVMPGIVGNTDALHIMIGKKM